MNEHVMQIELEGLIKLLAQNLYSDPEVFLREMIQNAHDAIIKRKALSETREDHNISAPEIHITTDRDAHILKIFDNGAGLSKEEIHAHLSTIGKSGTREFREMLQNKDKKRAVELIGQFGIGLLSGFIVANKIEVITRSIIDTGYKWTNTGSKNYSIEDYDIDSIGTTTILYLSKEHTRYLEKKKLHDIVRKYADLIGVPIYIDGEASPANAVNAPWHKDFSSETDMREDCYLYWEKRFREERSLDAWVVREPFRFYCGETGKNEEGLINGVLGITDRHIPGVDTRGTVDIYVKRMFIAASHREILPPWARFIQGVVECNYLTVNAARDDIVRNEALAAVRDTLGQIIIRHLENLYRTDSKRLGEIMRYHSYNIMTMSLQPESDLFFEKICDMVPLESDRGYLTLPEYLETAPALKDGRKIIHYITETRATSQYYMLCEAKGFHVFDATVSFNEEFLEKYAKLRSGKIILKRLDVNDSEDIFEPVPDEILVNFRNIEAGFGFIRGVTPQLSRFKPKEIPALLAESDTAGSRREVKEMAENLSMPDFIRDKLKLFLSENIDPMTLHINVDNPIINRLAQRSNLSDDIGIHALTTIYNNAVMMHPRSVTPPTIRIMCDQYNRLIEALVNESETRVELENQILTLKAQIDETVSEEPIKRKPLSRCITCFVAMPFNNHRRDRLYSALEQILEDEPYFWNLIRADETVADARLWKNVAAQIESAHCHIAEVTEHNPNVMIEIGRMEAYGRPVVLIKQKNAPSPPADLRERLHVEYDGEGDNLVENLREDIAKQKQFVNQQGEPYLSVTLLKKIQGLSEQFCKKIADQYESCTDFISASPEQVSEKLGINVLFIKAAQEYIQSIVDRQYL